MSYGEKTINNNPFLRFLVAPEWRLRRHIIFLSVVIWFVSTAEPHYLAPWNTYIKLEACFVILFPFYTNLYWLIPRFLFRNKYGHYAAAVLMLAGLTGLLSLAKHQWLDPYQIDPRERHEMTDPVSLLLFAVFLLLPSTAFRLFQRTILDNQRIAELERISMQSELQQLKNQINPHFLFNMLNNVNVLTQQDPEKASQVLHKLSDLLRYQLYDSSREHVLLTADIRFLTDFLNLEKIRRDNFDFIVSKEGEIGNILIPPHLFITFIENAVKHNVDPEMGSYVYAWFNVYGDELHFKCINSRPQQSIGKNGAGGLGLANAKRTLELLYPDRHRLEIRDEATIYCVNLSIQL
ncbi:MAG TPA: histidine kinase [Puia sp.]|nr:histidine kinase [Puia sp.]